MKQPVRRLLLTTLLLGATVAQAQDPATVDPSIYRQVFDNPRVRVLEATFAPGAKMATHSHPDHFGYVLEAGTLNITDAAGKTETFELQPGQTLWLPATTHSAENKGTTRIKVLVVELKEPAPAPAPASK